MSASNKKKLRSEEYNQKLTERQLQEQKEAKKLKLYTAAFVVVLTLMIVAALVLGVTRAVTKSGILEKNTVALTVGKHELNSVEMNYFYVDSVISYYSQVGAYASLLGLDINTPLDEQVIDPETGMTWADSFMDSAIADAKNVYALADAAEAASYALAEEHVTSIDNELLMSEFNAMYAAGYPSMDSYLKAMYGNGASKESYREYLLLRSLAGAYLQSYGDALTYEDADLREAEKENFNKYSSFTFNYQYLPVSSYLEGGTKDENGTTSYTDDEKTAAQTKAEELANGLIGDECTSVDAFNALVAALPDAKEGATSTAITNKLYSDSAIPSILRDWVASPFRKAGDKNVIPSTSTSTVDGKEVTTVNGYYAVYFVESNDNNYPLVDVRHILVEPENGTYNSNTGYYDYTEEAWAAAKTETEELFKQWQDGEKTAESFGALANEKSDDGNGTTGGLIEDVAPGTMVTAFNDWCFDESRQPGDTDIVQTEHGMHIVYFVGDSETLYRDYMITNELRSADVSEWNTGLTQVMTATTGNTKYVMTGLLLKNYNAG